MADLFTHRVELKGDCDIGEEGKTWFVKKTVFSNRAWHGEGSKQRGSKRANFEVRMNHDISDQMVHRDELNYVTGRT